MTRRTAIGTFFAGLLTPILTRLGRDKKIKTAVCKGTNSVPIVFHTTPVMFQAKFLRCEFSSVCSSPAYSVDYQWSRDGRTWFKELPANVA